MKTKIILALLNRHREKGAVLPLVLGLGVIMVLTGMTMIVRSSGDQQTAIAQNQTSEAMAAAEVGVTRVQEFLNEHRSLALVNYPWSSHISSTTSGLSCGSGSNLAQKASALEAGGAVGSGNARFRIISYNYAQTDSVTNTGIGTLVVEGRVGTDSTARLRVEIPVKRNQAPSFAPPGAWARNFGLGNNQIHSDVVIDASCNGSLSSSEINQIRNSSGTTNPAPKIIQNPSFALGSPLTPPANAITLPAISSSLMLPRASDNPNSNGEYVYRVGSASGNSINLTGNDELIIQPGRKVTLYLDGNVRSQGGQVKIGHNCYDTSNPPDGLPNSSTKVAGCEPTNFKIYGGANTTSVLLGGSNTVDAFIFAPNAIQSGVNGAAQVRGSVWLREWDAANGSHTVIVQTADWGDLPTALRPPHLTPASTWVRQPL